MTRGTTKSNNSNVVNANLLGMKPEDDLANYHFEISRGFGDTKEVIANSNFIEGKLSKIELGGYEYEKGGQKRFNKTITFVLNDGENEIRYGSGYNRNSRQIVYNLASISGEIGTITISSYISKKGNKNIWVKNNGQDVMMKFDFEKDIKSKSKYNEEFQKISYAEADKWIEEELIPAINEKLKKQQEDEVDELPF